MPESSTDTDGQTELPLSTELTAKLSAFVAQEKAVSGKKRSKVWSESEKQMVISVWQEKKQSLHGTINHLQRAPQHAGTSLHTVDCKGLRWWIECIGELTPGEPIQFKKRGRKRVEEFETAILSECIIADHVAPQGCVPGTHDVAVIASDLHSYTMVQEAARIVQASEQWNSDQW